MPLEVIHILMTTVHVRHIDVVVGWKTFYLTFDTIEGAWAVRLPPLKLTSYVLSMLSDIGLG